MSSSNTYGLYGRSPFIYDSYIEDADYGEGARRLTALVRRHTPAAETLLDVGCGSGKYLERLRRDFRCEGLDVSDEFLKLARARCPDVPIHKGDMTGFFLGKSFDAISCLFLAIAYVKTIERLESAVRTMAQHLNPGGVLIVEPWIAPDQFWEDRLVSQYIEEDNRTISRMYVARKLGNLSIYDIHYLVGASEGVEHFVEREELGLFTIEEYVSAFERAGLQVSYDDRGGLFDRHNIGVYCGVKPS